ncbi:MAG: acetylornithine/succinylornithine family transaminase [Calditrichaceae bacterium]|jgi:acetylornithine/N-succinyldiaminopimelate aminotransferase
MEILKREQNYFLNVYKRFPIDLESGKGACLFDKNGARYLDFLSGIAVNSLGYNHPEIIAAIKKQIDRNLHICNYYIQDIQLELAEKLIDLTSFSKLFFTNSGTESIEGLLKLAKKWGRQHGKNEIIAFEGSFHGRSLGSLSITMQDKYQKNFHPLLANIKKVPFNNAGALADALSKKTAAVFYEGITGEGGIRPVSDEIFKILADGRDRYDFLIFADEIQTGVGRTGKLYYYENCPIIPDGIATAKALGGGLPLGAFLVNDRLTNIFDIGEHGTTFGGNPLACAAGLAAINIISQNEFLENVINCGNYLFSMLDEIRKEFDDIAVDVRGRGLMLGLEVNQNAAEIMSTAFNQGLIFNTAGGNTLRFLPPLIIDEKLIDEAYDKLHATFSMLFH